MPTLVLAVLALPLFVLVVLRLTGWDGNRYTIAALALTPYAAIGGLVLGTASLLLGQWWIGGFALLLAVTLGAVLLPRVLKSVQPAVDGSPLRLMVTNLYYGQADAEFIVNLVRDHKIEVLNLLELNEPAVNALERAGLFTLLPHRVLHPAGDAEGSGIASVYPLSEEKMIGPSIFAQPSVKIELPTGDSAEVVAVHPVTPIRSASTWRAELNTLPKPSTKFPVRILAGDFNATLDHAQLRGLLNAGYVDAADQLGRGFIPTWPHGKRRFPVMVLDHVLVDSRIAVDDYRVFSVPGTDHSAIYADLVIPAFG